jgi:hypothetical protein
MRRLAYRGALAGGLGLANELQGKRIAILAADGGRPSVRRWSIGSRRRGHTGHSSTAKTSPMC